MNVEVQNMKNVEMQMMKNVEMLKMKNIEMQNMKNVQMQKMKNVQMQNNVHVFRIYSFKWQSLDNCKETNWRSAANILTS